MRMDSPRGDGNPEAFARSYRGLSVMRMDSPRGDGNKSILTFKIVPVYV